MSDSTTTPEQAPDVAGPADETGKADRTVRNHAVGSAVIGAIPMPPLVVAALLAINLKMLYKLSRIYNVEFQRDVGKSIIYSFLGACGAASVSGRVTWGLSQLVPAGSTIISAVGLPVFAAGLTYGIGKLFIQHFESGGTFLNFDPEEVRAHFFAEFEEGKRLAVEGGMEGKEAQPATA
jgi:uncharacterized protein (DUF697 family)